MLSVSQGSLIMLSTPWGRRGVFFEEFVEGGPEWERFEIPASASNTTPAWSQRTMLTIWLLTELPSKGTWKVPAWRTVRRRGGSESVRKDEITQIASALLRSAGGRGRLEEKPCLPVLCALSCVVRWSTQSWQGYTGLILRQLGCNNL